MGKAAIQKPVSGAIEKPAMGGALVEGRDSTMAISRVALFQGTAEEEQMYGSDFKRGEFIETLEKKSLGTSIRIVCVGGWTSFAKFIQGQKAPVYSVRKLADVPKEDREWSGEGANKTPPAVTETVNMVVLVNDDATPSLFLFKRTGLKAYQRTIEPCEAKFGRCVYELSSVDDKNASGQPYKRLTARMVKRLTEEDATTAIVKMIEDQFNKAKAKFEAAATDHDAATKGDDIPF